RAGRFTWDGRDYQLPPNDPSGKNAIHGFACRRPWRVVEHGTDERGAWITGTFVGTRKSADGVILWPADHSLRVTYRLSTEGLRVEALVTNPDDVPLPFGLGYHPYFRVPFRAGVRPEDYCVDVPASSFWELQDVLPTGKRWPVEGPRDLRLSTPFD